MGTFSITSAGVTSAARMIRALAAVDAGVIVVTECRPGTGPHRGDVGIGGADMEVGRALVGADCGLVRVQAQFLQQCPARRNLLS